MKVEKWKSIQRGDIEILSWYPDGSKFLSAELSNSVCVWDPSNTAVKTLYHNGIVVFISWHPNEKMFVCGTHYSILSFWCAETLKKLGEIDFSNRLPSMMNKDMYGSFKAGSWSPDGTLFALAVLGDIFILDGDTFALVHEIKRDYVVSNMHWMPNQTHLCIVDTKGRLYMNHIESPEPEHKYTLQSCNITIASVSPDGKYLLLMGNKNHIYIHEIRTDIAYRLVQSNLLYDSSERVMWTSHGSMYAYAASQHIQSEYRLRTWNAHRWVRKYLRCNILTFDWTMNGSHFVAYDNEKFFRLFYLHKKHVLFLYVTLLSRVLSFHDIDILMGI